MNSAESFLEPLNTTLPLPDPLHQRLHFRKFDTKHTKKSAEFAELRKGDAKHYNIPPIVQVLKCKRSRAAPPGWSVHPSSGILGWESQHAYIKRWMCTTPEELSENIKFSVERNDSKRESLLMLLKGKDVLVKQSPNMSQ